jgi:hypothetical protein
MCQIHKNSFYVDEDYGERETLLNEVLELLEEEGQKEKEENTAKEIRKRALDNL